MNILNTYTLKTLKKNKSRTIVTIVGIILSLAMLSGVTILIASGQRFLLNIAKQSSGDWYGCLYGADKTIEQELSQDEKVSYHFSMQNLGYSPIEDPVIPTRPYLFIGGIDEGFKENMPLFLVEGSLPQNSSEIILSQEYTSNHSLDYSLGDKITLEIGSRSLGGEGLNQFNPVNLEVSEVFTSEQTCTFTLVGIYRRPSFEEFSAPGYTALTALEENADYPMDIYIKTGKAKDIDPLTQSYCDSYPKVSSQKNYELLRFMGMSGESTFNKVLYGLGTILIAIIVFASISLIYNAFSISVSERISQFGLLSSIGATKKQLKRSVLFEAVALCCIGIPLGILSGMIGISITLLATRPLFELTFGDGYINGFIPFTPAPWALALAAVLGIITVLISAYIPANKAMKMSVIDAVRKTGDVKLSSKEVHVGALSKKLFGFEGTIALKNLKRNKKRYRATIISLFMSIVLFVSAMSFCDYLSMGLNMVMDGADHDIACLYYPQSEEGDAKSIAELYNELRSLPDVTNSNYIYQIYSPLAIDSLEINEDYAIYLSNYESSETPAQEGITTLINVPVLYVNNEEYHSYLTQNNLDPDVYMDAKNPVALAVNKSKVWDPVSGKYHIYTPFKDCDFKITFKDGGNPVWVKGQSENLPFGLGAYSSELSFLLPESAKATVYAEIPQLAYGTSCNMFFDSPNPNKTYTEMQELTKGTNKYLSNVAHEMAMNRSMITLINVFSYGFIVLISLIAAANVFNTISTGISLRRREFAMLKSIGMTNKGFDKMMNLECILYGLKSTLYGLPVAIFISYLIYRVVANGLDTTFRLPYYGIIISVLSVFVVVFSTMMYSTRRVKRENTVDALRNENL
ncbi:MAG: ABC transporter permease [Oscillospiraceae bacterium]